MALMEQILPQFILSITNVLHKEIFVNSIVSIYLWSLVHFIFGFGIYYLVRKEKYPFLIVFGLLVAFEFFEVSISYFAPIILKETLCDLIWDLIIGFGGAGIGYLIFKNK